MNLNQFLTLFRYLVFTIFAVASYSAFAHEEYGNNNSPSVILYNDCDYSGNAERLNLGNYDSLRHSSVGNDGISSIRVPDGVSVIIYEDDDFQGEQQRIYQNVTCLPGNWNDRISSIRVITDRNEHTHNDQNYGNNRNYNHNDRYPNPANSQYDNKPRCYDYKVYAYKGAGAFRFTDKTNEVIKVNNSAKQGSTCRSGKSTNRAIKNASKCNNYF